MPHTGQTCIQGGFYRSRCQHKDRVRLHQFDDFPYCSIDGQAVDWVLELPVRE